MNEGDIIYLKSSGPKMIIQKIINPRSSEGGLENLENDTLAIVTYARIGDYFVKWGNKKEDHDILPKEAVIDDINNLTDKIIENIELGNVVKAKINDTLMTVCWIVGIAQNHASFLNYNEILKKEQGLKEGDFVCRWFDNNKLNTGFFSSIELEKLKE